VSIDDFYLTRAEQVALAAAHPDHPYWEHRGYPGTHDLALGDDTLDALGRLGPDAPAGEARVPVYDKSAHGGRGDRVPRERWRHVRAPIDVVFVEGWMLGFAAVDDAAIQDRRLIGPNHALRAYARWTRHLDLFVTLRATDARFVIDWRIEAEERMKAAGAAGLDRAAIEDYVRRFLPAYALWDGTIPAIPGEHRLTLWLDEHRRVVPAPA
jgi:D-glycerate 3-kinase